jgi:hypothetical protein
MQLQKGPDSTSVLEMVRLLISDGHALAQISPNDGEYDVVLNQSMIMPFLLCKQHH